MAALNIPSAADIERLARRVRSVSQRLEGIEDAVDRLDERLAKVSTGQRPRPAAGRHRGQARRGRAWLAALHEQLPGAVRHVPRDQERLEVPAEG